MLQLLSKLRRNPPPEPVAEGLVGPMRPGRQYAYGGKRIVWMENPWAPWVHPDSCNWSSVLRFEPGSGIWPQTQLSGCDGFRERMNLRAESKFFRYRRGVLMVFVRDPDAKDRGWQIHRLDAESKFVFVPPGWSWGVCTADVNESAVCELYGHPSIFRHHDEGGNQYGMSNEELPDLMRERIRMGFVSKLSRTPGWGDDTLK